MLATLSGKEVDSFVALSRAMIEAPDALALREAAGPLLLDLFAADQFASFVFNGDADDTPVIINMDPGNVERYRAYYQYHDPITSRMRRCGRAVHVNDVLDQDALERTEFFNDFLARDGLCHGMNFHAFAWRNGRRCHLGDLRVWRARKRGNFGRREVELLQAVGELFQASLAAKPTRPASAPPSARELFATRYGLTAAETRVLECLSHGRRDSEIAARLEISPETVRSHLKAIFQKSHLPGRLAVISALLEER